MKNLTPLPFTRLHLADGFWRPRQQANRTVTLPHIHHWLAITDRLNAWDFSRWEKGNPALPHIFWDSDIAKWIEAVAYSLAESDSPELVPLVDAAIAAMEQNQAADGYLNSHFQASEPDKRFTNLRDRHELYCAGHLTEAAVAYFEATGKRTLLDVVCRYVDYIDKTFGPQEGKLRGYPGHEELELALIKLYKTTKEQRYLDLARYFIEERGRQPYYYDLEAVKRGDDPAAFRFGTYAYMQAHKPIREQDEVVGHSVRAMYFYSAVADLARETGDESLLEACKRLWNNLMDGKIYVTGGIGSSGTNEGFTDAYDLPNQDAYVETCASIGLVYWSQRMLNLTGEGQYADAMEKVLYNSFISGLGLDGRTFFYENPLASNGSRQRQEWYSCACCPPNVARLIASLGDYFYSTDENHLWLHLYAQGTAEISLPAGKFTLTQQTGYPWDGSIRLRVEGDAALPFGLKLRIPGWCADWQVKVNGQDIPAEPENGYITIERTWNPGDGVTLRLEMPVRHIFAHPRVASNHGRAAIQRGPIIFCFEAADNEAPLDTLGLPDTPLAWLVEPWAFGVALRATGWRMLAQTDALYSPVPPVFSPAALTAIPYYAWANRAMGEMRVWMLAG